MTDEKTTKLRRGFAVMDRNVVQAIASEGGKAAHAAGTGHEFTRDEARRAGKLGGLATAAKRAGISVEEYLRRKEKT